MCMSGGKESDVYIIFLLSYSPRTYSEEKFGIEEMRLALLAPLPTVEATIHTKTISLLLPRKIVL